MTEPTFSREFCEQEYDTRATAPNWAQVLQRRMELSLQARASLHCHSDLAYGPTDAERLDIFPGVGLCRGVMVFIHGGYWQSLDKSNLAFLAKSFVDAGIALVLPNYTLAPIATLDRMVGEVRSACSWVWHNVERYGGDPNRIYVGGNSAGAHLAAMVAATTWAEVDAMLPVRFLRGCLGISGIYDLEPILFTSINDALRLDMSAAKRNSPIRYAPTIQGWMLAAVGELESSEFQRQTAELAGAWGPAVRKPLIVKGCHHSSILLELADGNSVLFGSTRELMELP